MLNKYANCYNIEKNFKYRTVISTFSEHITIFRTLSIDIWQLKWQQLQTSANFSELSNISSSSVSGKYFGIKSCYKLVRPFSNVELFSIFSQTFFGTNFRHQNENNIVETISCFADQLSKKYCVNYVSEHLKYCLQVNEYWLNKNACLNIV